MASSLKKAKILVFNRKTKSKTGEIPCQFNPESFGINKSASWGTPSATATEGKENHPQPKLNAPELVFSGGQGATFNLKLFFDTTNDGNGDVRGYTNQLLKLTLITGKDTNSPPLIRFSSCAASIVSCLVVPTDEYQVSPDRNSKPQTGTGSIASLCW